MQWQFVVALAVIVPIVLFPVAFVWYLNLGGLYAWMRRALRERRAARKEEARVGLAERRV